MESPFDLLLDGHAARDVLTAALCGSGSELESVEIVHAHRRTFAKASRAADSVLTICYRVQIAGQAAPMLVHGRAALRSAGDAQSGELVAPFPGGALALRVFPDDPGLPQVAVLADVATARAAMPAAVRDHLAADATVSVVSFRPGERCSFDYRPVGVAGGSGVFAKCFAGDHSTIVARRIAALAQSDRERLLVPPLLGHDATLGTVWQARAAGASPWAAVSREGTDGALPRVTAALAELHAADAPAPVALRAQRMVEAVRKVRKLVGAEPALERDAHAALVTCAALEAGLPPEGRELRHGDAHLGQFLLAGDCVAAFDWDELAHGDLEQDLAALAVELEDAAHVGCVRADAAGTLVTSYRDAARQPRRPDPRLFGFHYRLQRLDRAYRDWWRRGASAHDRVIRSIALAAGGPDATLRAALA